MACLVLLASPAHAAITNVVPFNGNEDPIAGDEIFDYDGLEAYVTSPSGGDVCLQHYDTDPAPCPDGGYLITPVLPFYAGFYPIAPGGLMPGHWVMVGSEGADDDAVVTAVSADFWVRPCKVGCPPPEVKPRSQFKSQALQLADSVKTVCGLVEAASMLWRAREAAATVDLMMATYSGGLAAGFVLSIAVQGAKIGYDVVKGESLTAKLPGMLGTVAEKACKLADKASEAAESSWAQYAARWGADPPDYDYYLVSPPDFVDADSILGYPSWGYDHDRDNLDAVRAYSASSLHAYERYQAADLDNSFGARHAQSAEIARDMIGYASSLRRGANFLNATAGRMRSEYPDAADRTFSQSELDKADALRDRLAATGFTADEVTRLKQLGAGDDAIARLRRDLTAADPSDAVSGALDGELDRLAGDMRTMAEEAELFARTAGVAAGRDSFPIAPSFVAGFRPGDPLDVPLTDNTLNPGSDRLTIQWDFGDGTTGEGRDVRHRYATKGVYSVTETVSSDYETASVTQPVTAGPPNERPVADFTATPPQGNAPLTVHFDASASTDSDGTISTYEWDFGDGSGTAQGKEIDHEFQNPSGPGYPVKLVVTDDGDQKGTRTKTVVVTEPPTAPVAVADLITASPTGDLDVLGNDIDHNGDAVTITATTQPEHGTVDCTPSGACHYERTDGSFTGDDNFTYTITDPGGLDSEPANVTVAVSDPPQATEPVPVDDQRTIRAPASTSIDVLANDAGKGTLVFKSAGAAHHGTATCDAEGTCTYTPQAGFTGRDGFEYTMSDDTATEQSAEVHIVVVPEDATYGLRVRGEPAQMASGGTASWAVGVTGAAPELPEVSTEAAGPQNRIAGSTSTAAGWSATPTGAKAGAGALLGDRLSVPLVKPAATVSQGTGGDGHVPIVVGDRVFAFFHHSHPTQVSCIDRRTNRRCPGYPVAVGVGTGDAPGHGVVIADKIYLQVEPAGFFSATQSTGVFCFDTASARSCGYTIVDRPVLRGVPGGDATPSSSAASSTSAPPAGGSTA